MARTSVRLRKLFPAGRKAAVAEIADRVVRVDVVGAVVVDAVRVRAESVVETAATVNQLE